MNIGETLRETGVGILAWVTNELRIYARNDDAAKLRVGAPGNHGGCLSFNKVWLDANNQPTNEEEFGLIQIKQDERTRNDPNGARGEMTIHLNDGQGRQPDSLVPVMLIRTDGYTMLVPRNDSPEHPPDNQGPIGDGAITIHATSPSGFPNKLVSPDGRVELDIQNVDALNMTLYRDGVALWSVATGLTQAGRALGWR